MPGFRSFEDDCAEDLTKMSDLLLNDFLTSVEETPLPEVQTDQHSSNLNSVPAELLCPRCLELYEMPLFLPCSHTFCRSCTESLINSSDKVLQQRNRFICPTCRNIIKYGSEGVDCLPRNVNLEQAVTRFKLDRRSRYPDCSRHQQFNMQVIMWCEDCGRKLCPLCALEDTHKDHKIAPLKVFHKFKEVKQRLKQATKVLTNKIETIGGNILEARGVITKIEAKAEDLRKRVDEECNEMSRQVEIRRENMYKDIERATQKKQYKRKEEIKLLKTEYNETKELLEKISVILEKEGPTEFMKELEESGLTDKVDELSKLSS